MAWRKTLIVVVAGVALFVTGCATATDGNGPGSSGSTGTVDPSAADPGTSPTGLPTLGGTMTLDPSVSAGAVTLKGTVEEGVEAGCTLLNADNGAVYLLLGGDRQVIVAGARVEVEVVVQTDLVTTCQQGTPATVQSARRI